MMEKGMCRDSRSHEKCSPERGKQIDGFLHLPTLKKNYICLVYSILALTTDAICIISIVWPSFNFVKSVTLPVLLVMLVLLNILINLASATIFLPAFSGLPLIVLVCSLFALM